MKKTLMLLAALAFTTAGTSFAQTTTPAAARQSKARTTKAAKTPAQKADRHAAKMAKELGLTADQEARVEQLLVARQQESAAFKAKYGTDKKAGRNEKRAAHDRYESQLKSILTTDQYAKLGQLKAERRSNAKMKDGGKTKVKAKA
ncbi:hypothetical protein BEN47_05630 [Hymenobacter lapidarius]|uniref:DUF4890 domain-containing protein n=1 Tax=Hymenobacter lapidarius TaxID=1908237 RepID=A0A1G1SS27_9BACT|nr:hypothetical protein [Hymenobacter lapidarius]OGX81428.1 hypothetical protein BEN47_05630 [Hymenobacter lapidarius]